MLTSSCVSSERQRQFKALNDGKDEGNKYNRIVELKSNLAVDVSVMCKEALFIYNKYHKCYYTTVVRG